MPLIAIRNLRSDAAKYPDTQIVVEEWYKVVKSVSWQNLEEVKQIYRDTEAVGNFTVFNIKGNKFCSEAEIAASIFSRTPSTHKLSACCSSCNSARNLAAIASCRLPTVRYANEWQFFNLGDYLLKQFCHSSHRNLLQLLNFNRLSYSDRINLDRVYHDPNRQMLFSDKHEQLANLALTNDRFE
jgi:mRNA-degrading endonuclease HigB of HigAB toxin-antitoxin module